MKRHQSLPKTRFNAIIGFICLAMIWVMFIPVQFGGWAAYLIVSGVSMEPTLHTGDLVILHQTDSYEIGDIAAYYYPIADGIVIHRIIGQQENRFILLGDNKPKVDPYQPSQAEMIGKYIIHIPGLGLMINQAKSLGLLSTTTLIILLGLLLIAPLLISRVKPKQRDRSFKQKGKSEMKTFNLSQINRADFTFFLVILALAAAILAYFGFKQPLTQTVSNDISYQQTGTFNYSAVAPPGIYNADKLQTGEPIFRQLITQFRVDFDYQLTSAAAGDVAGTYRLSAEISHQNGWNRTIELTPQTPFQGPDFTISSGVDISQIQLLLDNIEQQTGLQNQHYTLAIVPQISISGFLADQPFQDNFAPPLAFNFDAAQLQLANHGSNNPNVPPQDPLKPSQSGTINHADEAPNIISILGLSLTVATIRQIAIAGLIMAIAGLIAFAWLLFRAKQSDQAAQIELKYNSHLINIQNPGLNPNQEIIEVTAIDDLVRLAERDGCMILHYRDGSQHQYFIKTDTLTYRYQPPQSQSKGNVSLTEGVS